MTDLLIVNANVVSDGEIRQLDVAIEDGRISQLGKDLSALASKRVIDATGLTLMPGMIDDQVHFREPGLTHKGEIATESRAAVAGGITSYMEMPNVNPLTIDEQALEDKYQRAAQKSLANFSFYLGASNDNLEVIKRLDPKAACGVKVFMGASTGNMLVDDPVILENIFASSPILIATHCEDTPTITANENRYRGMYGDNVPMSFHPLIRSEEACYMSSSMAIELARKHNSRLHVLHLTTEKELTQFAAGDHRDKRITAEACVHHLFFSDGDYDSKGALIKCNPAVKQESDRLAILTAIQEDRIDIIATDHAPHTWEEKQNSYFKAPSGLPLVQDALLSLLEHYHRGIFSLEQIVKKTSHAVADCFDLVDRGYVREGYWADLVLVDLNKPTRRQHADALSKCGWTPFDGYEFSSAIQTTLVNGEVMFEKGVIVSENKGQRLLFNR
ncbi:dihydroorotase [Gynuella sp.]|uniref:dihydroorotase n=1 Tax=Gynuella sp. TaxID=2969146 RepID=UPI003D123DA0